MSKRFLFLIVAAILVSQPLIASTPDAVPHSKFLQGGFVDVGAGFADLSDVDAEWGDYDHDGDPDLLLWGRVEAENTRRTVIYRNDAGVFVDIGADLLGMSKSDGTSIWIDYDADGDLDVLQSGSSPDATPLPYATRIYRNDGADTFVEAATDLPALGFSSAGWGDYDGDGDPDLLLTGSPSLPGATPRPRSTATTVTVRSPISERTSRTTTGPTSAGSTTTATAISTPGVPAGLRGSISIGTMGAHSPISISARSGSRGPPPGLTTTAMETLTCW